MAKFKVNSETGMMEFDDGRVLPIPDKYKKELLPANRAEELKAEEIGKIRSKIGILGGLGEGAFQFGEGSSFVKGGKDVTNYISSLSEAISPKEGQQDLSFWERQGENYAAKRAANESLSSQISEESPVSSTIGKGLGIGADLLATRGMSGAKALPLMSVAEKGTDIIREPGQAAKDAAISAGLGFAGDKLIGGISKIANRRGAIKENLALQREVAESNLLGQEATNLANAENKAANILENQNIKIQNAENLRAHQIALDQRKQTIIDLKNQRQRLVEKRNADIANLKTASGLKKAEWERDVAGIKNELSFIEQEEKAAQKAYNEEVSRLPELKKMAQQEHSQNVMSNVSKLEKILAKDDRIYGSQISPSKFIENTISTSERAGTKEAREVERFIKSLFPEEKALTRQDLIQRYQSIEKRIQKSNPEVADLLNEFKYYLGEKLPGAIQDATAYRKISKPLSRDIEKYVNTLAKDLKLSDKGLDIIRNNSRSVFENIPRNDFVQHVSDGSLKQKLKYSIFTDEAFGFINPNFDLTKKYQQVAGNWMPTQQAVKIFEDANYAARLKKTNAIDIFDKEFDSIINNFIPDLEIVQSEAKKRIGRTFSNTLGRPAEVALPTPPSAMVKPQMPPPLSSHLELPAEIPHIIEPPLPVRPDIIPPTAPFTPEVFNPKQIPTLSNSSGVAERAGDALENFRFGDLLKSKSVVDNPLTKLAGLKYLLGKAALPVEGAVLGGVGLMKAITSPSSLGQMIRRGAKKGGLSGVYRGFDEYAKTKYPSYQNGVIDSPKERFDAIAEIEKDPLLDIQEKAMLQMKINRGESIKR
jgi:hypothetical protein